MNRDGRLAGASAVRRGKLRAQMGPSIDRTEHLSVRTETEKPARQIPGSIAVSPRSPITSGQFDSNFLLTGLLQEVNVTGYITQGEVKPNDRTR